MTGTHFKIRKYLLKCDFFYKAYNCLLTEFSIKLVKLIKDKLWKYSLRLKKSNAFHTNVFAKQIEVCMHKEYC